MMTNRERHRALADALTISVMGTDPYTGGPAINETMIRLANALLETEMEMVKWRNRFDGACAVLHAPDSTNDGGPADLAEDIKNLLHNYNLIAMELGRREKNG